MGDTFKWLIVLTGIGFDLDKYGCYEKQNSETGQRDEHTMPILKPTGRGEGEKRARGMEEKGRKGRGGEEEGVGLIQVLH